MAATTRGAEARVPCPKAERPEGGWSMLTRRSKEGRSRGEDAGVLRGARARGGVCPLVRRREAPEHREKLLSQMPAARGGGGRLQSADCLHNGEGHTGRGLL